MSDVTVTVTSVAGGTVTVAGSGGGTPTIESGSTVQVSVSDFYALPAATTSTLGGVIVGSGLGVTSGTASVIYGTAASTACRGDDARLSNVRSPSVHAGTHGIGGSDAVTPVSIGAATVSHTHDAGDIASGTIAAARMPSTVVQRLANSDGGITVGPAFISPTTTPADLANYTLLSLSNGNDVVASVQADGRASFIGGVTAASLPLATTTVRGAVIVGTGLSIASGTVSATYGTTAGTACQGNDSRLANNRAPTAHKSTHATGGSDALTAGDIGAALAIHGHNAVDVFVNDLGTSLFATDEQLPEVFVSIENAIAGRAAEVHTHSAGDITSGTIATARLASGTASASTYLRGDQTWATVASYTLPNATTTTLGGVIVGAGLSVSSGTVSANVASVAGRTGTITLAHSDVANSPATLTQFSASQNNLALGTGGIIRISSSAAVNVTGLVATSAGDARLLSNVGTFAITLKHSDAASTAANRILCVGNADVEIPAGGSAVVYYDGTDSRWRVG